MCVQVSEAKVKADEAKLNAQEVLAKTNETKKRVDGSNEELRQLIKQIRDFLTRKTHLASFLETSCLDDENWLEFQLLLYLFLQKMERTWKASRLWPMKFCRCRCPPHQPSCRT